MWVKRNCASWFFGLVLILSLGACASTSGLVPQRQVSQVEDNADSERQVVTACTDLVLDYALYRDQLDAEKLAALFTQDARLSVQGKTYIGQQAIRARTTLMRSTEAVPKTRHLMSTIRIRQVSADKATGISYVTVYAGADPSLESSDKDESGLETVKGFAIIGNYIDEFERTAQGWRIARRRLEGAFRDASYE